MNKIIINIFNINEDLDNSSNLLIINNKKQLYLFLSMADIDYIKIIDENLNILKTSDYVDVTPSVLNLDINSKKNINALIRQIKKTESDIIYLSEQKIANILKDTFKNVAIDYPLDLISDIDFNTDDIIKLLNIKLNEHDKTLLERLQTYIKVSCELRNIKIFIFFDLYSFLEEHELKSLINECKYYDIKIINVEYYDVENSVFDKKRIIDNDLCVIE